MREAFAETASDALCMKETTEQVISQMVREANRHYSEIMAHLTLPQKELLYAIAKEHRAQQITSGAFIRRHSLNDETLAHNIEEPKKIHMQQKVLIRLVHQESSRFLQKATPPSDLSTTQNLGWLLAAFQA